MVLTKNRRTTPAPTVRLPLGRLAAWIAGDNWALTHAKVISADDAAMGWVAHALDLAKSAVNLSQGEAKFRRLPGATKPFF